MEASNTAEQSKAGPAESAEGAKDPKGPKTAVVIAEKVGMTQIFDSAGNAAGGTVLKVWPSTVVRLRTREQDGYEAMQIGAGEAKPSRIGKAVLGQSGKKPYRLLAEFPKTSSDVAVGAVLGAEQLDAGELVHVTSVSKGKGFQGTVKRHNFSRGPKTHGSRNYRKPGSIGGTGASRVFPGQKMPGRMGADRVTTRNVLVLSVDPDENLIVLRGSVPGPSGAVVTVRAEGIETKHPIAKPLGAAGDEIPEQEEEKAPVPKEKPEKAADDADTGGTDKGDKKPDKPEAKSDAKAEKPKEQS